MSFAHFGPILKFQRHSGSEYHLIMYGVIIIRDFSKSFSLINKFILAPFDLSRNSDYFRNKGCLNWMKNKHFTIFQLFRTCTAKPNFCGFWSPRRPIFNILTPFLFHMLYNVIIQLNMKFDGYNY